MSISWDTALYDPLFGVFGVVASLDTGTVYSVTVIDQTAGIEISSSSVDLPVIAPAASIRLSEMQAKGIEEDNLIDATLTIRSTAWTIQNCMQKPGPDGKGSGELVLILQNGDL